MPSKSKMNLNIELWIKAMYIVWSSEQWLCLDDGVKLLSKTVPKRKYLLSVGIAGVTWGNCFDSNALDVVQQNGREQKPYHFQPDCRTANLFNQITYVFHLANCVNNTYKVIWYCIKGLPESESWTRGQFFFSPTFDELTNLLIRHVSIYVILGNLTSFSWLLPSSWPSRR